MNRRFLAILAALLPIGILAWLFSLRLGGPAGVILRGLAVVVLAALVVTMLVQVRR